jgi:hypothetical protein
MLLDYVGEKPAAVAIENGVAGLLRDGRLQGVGTGVHHTAEVGDLVVAEVRAAAASV